MHKHEKFHIEFTILWVSRHPHTWLSDFPHATCHMAIGGTGSQAGHNLQSTQKPHQNHTGHGRNTGLLSHIYLFVPKSASPHPTPVALCPKMADCSPQLRMADLSFVQRTGTDTSTQTFPNILLAEQPLCYPEMSWWPVCQWNSPWPLSELCGRVVLCATFSFSRGECAAFIQDKRKSLYYLAPVPFIRYNFLPPFSTCN